jgi:transcriptional regulator with GAF, ATPase, and Fis domain
MGQGSADVSDAAFGRLALALGNAYDFRQILAALDHHARAVVDFDRISFALFERGRPGRMRVWGTPWNAAGHAGGEDHEVPLRGALADVVQKGVAVVRPEIDPQTLDPGDATDRAIVELGVRSLASVPLLAEGELRGAVTFSSRTPRRYQADVVQILAAVAAPLGAAVHRAQLLHDERRRAEQMRLLNEVARALVSSLDEREMLGRAVDLTHHVFDFVHLSAMVLEPAAPEQVAVIRLIAVAGRWAHKIPVGWAQGIDRGVIGRSVREARPVLVGDTSADPDYVPYEGIDSRTELVVPIIAHGEVLGVLNAESHVVHAFGPDDVQTLITIADQLASAMTNARLYATVAGMNERLEAEVADKTQELRAANAEIARQKERLAAENVNLRRALARRGSELVGTSPRLLAVLAMIDKVAISDAPVLIQGESGTGKELVAARLHRLSRRAGGPYVSVNAGAFPETLLESELFGHEAGAFTGATHKKPGLVETAEGGTLFLDEIGETAPALQAKLLRFLQDGEYYRVGAQKPLRADVRIVTATNRDLVREVAAGRFREDLLFRINTITVDMPPLRERPEDIPLLARHFLERTARGKRLEMSELLMTALVHYPWPGNVRELANVIERLAILGEDGELGLEFLPSHIVAAAAKAAPHTRSPTRTLDDVEREHVLRTLAKNGGDKRRTARELGIAVKTLYNKLGRWRGPARVR